MNEKIKSIALECYNPYGNFDLEKFAELIVRECAAQVEEESSWPYSSFGKKIKEHFGVKE